MTLGNILTIGFLALALGLGILMGSRKLSSINYLKAWGWIGIFFGLIVVIWFMFTVICFDGC